MLEPVKKWAAVVPFTAARQKMGLNKKSFIQLLKKFEKIKISPITLPQKAEIEVLLTGYQNGVWSVQNSHCVMTVCMASSIRRVLMPFEQAFYQSTRTDILRLLRFRQPVSVHQLCSRHCILSHWRHPFDLYPLLWDTVLVYLSILRVKCECS